MSVKTFEYLPDTEDSILYQEPKTCNVYGCNSKRFNQTEVDRIERYQYTKENGKLETIEVPVTIVVNACQKCLTIQEDIEAIQIHQHSKKDCSICTNIWTNRLRESISRRKDRFGVENIDGSIDLVDELGMGDPTSERSQSIVQFMREREMKQAKIRCSPSITTTGYNGDKFTFETPNFTKCLYGTCGMCNTCRHEKDMIEYRKILETKGAEFKQQFKKSLKYIKSDLMRMLNQRNEISISYGKKASLAELRTFKKYFGQFDLRGTKITIDYDWTVSLMKRWFQLRKNDYLHKCQDSEWQGSICSACHEMNCIVKQFKKNERYFEPRFVTEPIWNEATQSMEYNHTIDLDSNIRQNHSREFPWTENFDITMDMIVKAVEDGFNYLDDDKVMTTDFRGKFHYTTSTASNTGIKIGVSEI